MPGKVEQLWVWALDELFMKNPGYKLSVKLFVRVRLFCSDKYEVLQKMPLKGRTALSESFRRIIQWRRRTRWAVILCSPSDEGGFGSHTRILGIGGKNFIFKKFLYCCWFTDLEDDKRYGWRWWSRLPVCWWGRWSPRVGLPAIAPDPKICEEKGWWLGTRNELLMFKKNIEKLIKFRLFVFIVQGIQRLVAWCIYFT